MLLEKVTECMAWKKQLYTVEGKKKEFEEAFTPHSELSVMIHQTDKLLVQLLYVVKLTYIHKGRYKAF